MSMKRMNGGLGILLVVAALALALPGCGGGAPATSPDGTIELAPGTTDSSQESPNTPIPKPVN